MGQNTSPEQLPEPLPGNTTSDTPPQPTDSERKRKRGSLWVGFGVSWGIDVFTLMVFVFTRYTYYVYDNLIFIGCLVLPLVICAWLAIRGRWRTALGMVLGHVSAIALTLLFISICVSLYFPHIR